MAAETCEKDLQLLLAAKTTCCRYAMRKPLVRVGCRRAHKMDSERASKESALPAVAQAVVAGRDHLLYLDECDLHLLPTIRAMWM